DADDLGAMLAAGWGAAFTALSFLSTTGFASAEWETARLWSGMETHGLILLGLAIMGGGVATTAGGVKLLRVYALVLQGQGELQRLVHPRVVTGGGTLARHLRGEGARMAWVFFMLFAISIAVVTAALTLAGLDFETALIAGLAGLTTTGPLIVHAAEMPIRLMDMPLAAKAILGGAMVLGRIEALALLAVLAPQSWRR
ncbi:MAG TPA: potassium transporter TrkG, partial [Gemmobacter sp.]|nr:potassium transporter TrkG [Gemmobacter sp.]